jgi:glycosyltransferase involved in cell wall biosynthesis
MSGSVQPLFHQPQSETPPLRVLACVFTCCPPGTPGFQGGEHLLGWNLVNQIAKVHEVWALTHAQDRQSIEHALATIPIPNLHFEYVGLPNWLRPLLRVQGGHQFYYHLWQAKAYFIARSMHKKLDFQLFHHITYANDWLANFIGAFLPVPYVRGPGGGAHRTPKGFETEYAIRGRLWERVRSLGQWIFRHDPVFLRGQERARAILVCNRDSMSQIPKKWAYKAHLYPVSGISPDELPPISDAGSNGEGFRVLSAGSLIEVKGFGLAIRSFKEFAKYQPSAKLNIIGSGPEEPRLRALAQQNCLHDNVCFLGWKPHHEVLSEMASHDVFLFPSLRDGGGTVVIEAMGVGRPVVCLDVGGPGLHVTEGTGLKVAASSPQRAVQDLADALQRLFEDPELRLAMGRAARERALESYQWDRLGDRLMKIYQESLSSAST